MIRYGLDTDKKSLMEMWKLCFPSDNDRFIKFYFDNVYKNEETLVFSDNGQPVASVQMIPYRIKTVYNILKGGYISGAMTHPGHRKKGIMDKLLKTSFEEMILKNYDYTFLIPQEKWLIGMYEKYGFHLCEPAGYPPPNKVLKTSKQWSIIQRFYFDETGILLENEPEVPHEHKGMIKRLNPAAEEIKTLFMGMMLD